MALAGPSMRLAGEQRAEVVVRRRFTPRGEPIVTARELAEAARKDLQAFVLQNPPPPRRHLQFGQTLQAQGAKAQQLQRLALALPVPMFPHEDQALARLSPSYARFLDIHGIRDQPPPASQLLQLRHSPRKPMPLIQRSASPPLLRQLDAAEDSLPSPSLYSSPSPLPRPGMNLSPRDLSRPAVDAAPGVAPPPHAVRTSSHEPSPSTVAYPDDEAGAMLDTTWLLFPQPSPPPVDLPAPHDDEPVKTELLHSLSRIKIFRSLSPASLESVARAGRVREYARYSSLAKEGLVSSTFFGLLSGKLVSTSSRRRSTVDDSSVRQLHCELGDHFGEECLVTETTRDDSVGALTDVRVFVLTRNQLLGAPAELTKELRMTVQWAAAQKEAVLRRLSTLVYWCGVEERIQCAVAEMLEVMHVGAGATLFYEGSTVDVTSAGDTARYFYIFLDGHIRMTRLGTAHGQTPVDYTPQSTGNDGGSGILRPWFGEYALWFSKPRRAAAVALAPSLVLGMPENHFAVFLELVPDFLASSSFAAGRRRALAAVQTPPPSVMPSGEAGNLATAASLRWHSLGRLGARVGSTSFRRSASGADGKRSVFADRWERMVFRVLFNGTKMAEPGQVGAKRRASAGTVSLRVEDFNQAPSRREPC